MVRAPTARAAPAQALEWRVHRPPGPAATVPGWLLQIEEFRARLLYEGGRRPRFRDPAGSFADPDPVDRCAHHVVASAGHALAGCLRVLPLDSATPGLCERLVGSRRLGAVLEGLGASRSDAAEGGAWVVDPAIRAGSGVAMRLLALSVALAEERGRRVLVGAVGLRDGQLDLLARVGVRSVPGLGPIPLPGYDDSIQVVAYSPRQATPVFRAMVGRAAHRLALT